MSARCEGWHRTGIFQLGGTGHWEQCKKSATVVLTLKQDGKVKTLPACQTCWDECVKNRIKIIKVRKR